ncbi:hypothetical protein VM1G_02998 [Cytospora mali]|uniref:2EXR domain-containing protein n=1 Tax=Cytospora mali TaxID=578113 RepID=A0A194VUG4_CYTMA|nr:hypothetical protein VM1G_02998 [Valsa mali]
MSPAMDATTPSFTLFTKLVIDIRLIISGMALPADVHEVCVFSENLYWACRIEQPEVIITFPQIAHVCSESRAEALRHGKNFTKSRTITYDPPPYEQPTALSTPTWTSCSSTPMNASFVTEYLPQLALSFSYYLAQTGLLATLRQLACVGMCWQTPELHPLAHDTLHLATFLVVVDTVDDDLHGPLTAERASRSSRMLSMPRRYRRQFSPLAYIRHVDRLRTRSMRLRYRYQMRCYNGMGCGDNEAGRCTRGYAPFGLDTTVCPGIQGWTCPGRAAAQSVPFCETD